MTGINIITKFIVTTAIITITLISSCYPTISDRRLCYDQKCSVPISMATTTLKYQSNDADVMSFKNNVEVTVFSKSAGKRQDLWGVEIDGARGYVPSKFLREKRVMHKTLQHEVSTELVAKHDSKNDGTERQNNVPKIPVVSDDGKLTKVVQGVEKLSDIAKDEKSRSAPVLDQVSPSYEIHDGTTIPLTRNEEPSEPSYATQVPQGIAGLEDQPTLSFHPNIASTVTRKMPGDTLPIIETPEDPAKYMEAAGLSEETTSGKAAAEGIAATTTELPSKDAEAEEIVNKNSESSSGETPQIPDDNLSLSAIDDVETTVEATKEADVPTSQESVEEVEKITESSDDADDTEDDKEDDSEEETDAEHDSVEDPLAAEKNDTVSEQSPMEKGTVTAAVDSQVAAEKTDTFTEQQHRENEVETAPVDSRVAAETNSAVTDKPPVENKIEDSPVETGTEALASESLEKHIESERFNGDSNVAVRDNNLEINSTADAAVVDNFGAAPQDNAADIPVDGVDETSGVNVATKEATSNVDSSNAAQDTSSEQQGFADESEEIKSEQPVEETIAEAPPSNLNFMNPLFSRLSKLPALVKDVVDNAISGGASADDPVATDETANSAKPEVTTSSEEISDSKQWNSPNVDFSIDSNNNVYENDTDESNTAAVASEMETATSSESMPADDRDKIVNNSNDSLDNENSTNDSTAHSVETRTSEKFEEIEKPAQPGIYKEDELTGFRTQDHFAPDDTSSFNGFPGNRNLLNVGSNQQPDNIEETSVETSPTVVIPLMDQSMLSETSKTPEFSEERNEVESTSNEYTTESTERTPEVIEERNVDAETAESASREDITENTTVIDEVPKNEDYEENHGFLHEEGESIEDNFTSPINIGRKFWETFSYVVLTAFTTLLFSLGYYYIENTRRDGQLIAKINKLEKELLVSSKECTVLDDTLKSTKSKLDSIEDESFGSNEMVVSLKADLEASKTAKSELEDQVAMLEKELESATEAGLELERMLREILSTNNEDNPLAQSVEDLQTRLNAQQAANEALTNALNLKAQENENLTSDLAAMTQKCEQLEVEVTRVTEELKHQNSVKNNMEQTMLDKVDQLEKQVKDMSAERIILRKQLKGKEMEMKDLLEVVNQMNINNLDFEKLYNVSRVKAEASQLLEERDDLKIRLSEVEGAHQLLEEHVKLINEEVSSLSEQCKLAEKAKRDAETRVEVLSNFFKEKEAQRQKEEAVWLQKQGEVSSTVERLHSMQNEIHNYKQQIEMLKREILDQEREYKNQIASLETKSHEQWVIARQHERRLEESKAEAGQLRNRLTLIEKNLNDMDPEAKLHRLEANGETATSPQLFIGAEASSSPIMFTGSSGVPLPPPPSYLYGPPVPPFMPPPPHSSSGIPPYDVGQRPPPLGGRLSSPPPLHGTGSSRYDNPRSPPPPLSPSMLPPYGAHPHRAYPSPFANDRIHPPPPPPHSSMLPPPLGGSAHNWGDDTLPPLRNSGFQPHQQHHRDQQRARNHKGSLHSSGESLDKNV